MNQLEGSGPPPASQDRIDNLPTVHVNQEQVGKPDMRVRYMIVQPRNKEIMEISYSLL